jgi:hypothetical protein
VNLANNRSTKLETLIYSAHARTVRPTGADCPDRGPSGLRAGPSAGSFMVQTGCKTPFVVEIATLRQNLNCIFYIVYLRRWSLRFICGLV